MDVSSEQEKIYRKQDNNYPDLDAEAGKSLKNNCFLERGGMKKDFSWQEFYI